MSLERYLGDSVYAYFDDFQIKLRTDDDNNQVIYLNLDVYSALTRYVTAVLTTRKEKQNMSSRELFETKLDTKLTLEQLAEVLYEGAPHVQNLAEKLARQHGVGCECLSFYGLMGPDVQNFWKGIAKQLIDHAREWRPNEGSACVLSEEEIARLRAAPRVRVTYE